MESSSTDTLSRAQINQLEESTTQIPPVLFRAFSVEGSRGLNNELEMRPHDSLSIPRRSIFAAPPADIKNMLRDHLLWQYHLPSHFISWSSSMLWVLEHAARMDKFERKPNIFVAVMDTRRITDMSIFPATTLMNVYGVPFLQSDKDKLNPQYHPSEYLFYGCLRNGTADDNYNKLRSGVFYKAVRLEDIYKADTAGCLRMFSGRSSKDDRLHLLVEQHRKKIDNSYTSKPSRILPPLCKIARLFGRQYIVVVLIALGTAISPNRMPVPRASRASTSGKKTHMPEDWSDLAMFDASFIDPSLTEVRRMYDVLHKMLTPVPDLSAPNEPAPDESTQNASEDLAEELSNLMLGND